MEIHMAMKIDLETEGLKNQGTISRAMVAAERRERVERDRDSALARLAPALKNKNQRFSFQVKRSEGRYRSFFESPTAIKLRGMEVGLISGTKPVRITLMVLFDEYEEGNNCCFKWISLKYKPENVEAAKLYLNTNAVQILQKFKLYTLED